MYSLVIVFFLKVLSFCFQRFFLTLPLQTLLSILPSSRTPPPLRLGLPIFAAQVPEPLGYFQLHFPHFSCQAIQPAGDFSHTNCHPLLSKTLAVLLQQISSRSATERKCKCIPFDIFMTNERDKRTKPLALRKWNGK